MQLIAFLPNAIAFLTQICSLLRGGIAERGGVRVGHRIIEINNQSVVAVPHEKIVNLLATSVGEVRKCRDFHQLFNYFDLLDSHEDNAHFNVQVINRTRKSHLYLSTTMMMST